ncbi:MAG: VOC family protein [Actinomycetota bacterium]|nr:VOC family protein [Actinomycetota bacterium]
MAQAVAFYRSVGVRLLSGGPTADFSTFRVGTGYLNVQRDIGGPHPFPLWGRVILWVDDVDAMHRRCLDAGLHPLTAPADAPWGERFFHIRDPDGHELSFARPLV